MKRISNHTLFCLILVLISIVSLNFVSGALNVTINSPANNTTVFSPNVLFSITANATGGTYITNASFCSNLTGSWLCEDTYTVRSNPATLVLTSGTTVLSGNLLYEYVYVGAGATIQVGGSGVLNITALKNITILGTIDGDGKNSVAGAGSGGRYNSGSCYYAGGGGGGGSYASGGAGGSSSSASGGTAGSPVGNLYSRDVFPAGTKGGDGNSYSFGGGYDGIGGNGGAGIKLSSPTIIISGTINARGSNGIEGYAGNSGSNGAGGGGGGSGGTILIEGINVNVSSSTLRVSGGNGANGVKQNTYGNAGGGGGGSGGYVKIFYKTSFSNVGTTITNSAGTGGAKAQSAGCSSSFDGSASSSGATNSTSISSIVLGEELKTFEWTKAVPTYFIGWNSYVCNTENECKFAPSNYTVKLNGNPPDLQLLSGNGEQVSGDLSVNHSISFVATDNNLETCWLNYNNINRTISCSNGTTVQYNFTLVSGVYNATLYANNSASNLFSIPFSWNYLSFVNNVTYNATTYTSSTEGFSLNITFDSAVISSSAIFYYNGTLVGSATKTIDGGGNTIFSSSVGIPSTIGNKNFYWTIYLSTGGDEISFNTSQKTQSVLTPSQINVSTQCSAGLSRAMFFNFADEQNLTSINSTSIYYNLQYGYSGNTSILQSYGNLTNINNFTICINSSLPSYSVGYGEIQYYKAGYNPRRFYIFQNTRLTNETINNTLYLLPTSLATLFTFNVQNNFYVAQTNKFTTLLRWYPNLNSYKVVEMGRTDGLGEYVNSVDTDLVDYRIGVYEPDGTLIYLASPVRFICTVLPCKSTITTNAESLNLFNIAGLQHQLTYNYTSKVFTYIWNDPTQETSSMNLTVYRDSYDSSIIVCSSSGSSFTGLITCDVSAYTSGTMRAVVYRTASPSFEITSLLINIGIQISDVAGGKTIGLFISLILFIFAMLVGMFSPVVAIVLGIVALVPALFFGAFSFTFFVGLLLVGFIIIHFMRRS